ncbi:hypothetical protein ARALYDRAFT_906172 [Arabidopsis lyrata subsp. lyrata]|uniref:Ubiquitin-like domain-containing protein n=2 Tax=Arabidopsis lyrata subsp. lyrata TaxID=81972 RepID=D7LS50_ARALL|nr:uncharacterized protein LOC9313716 isoform X2 [Arabidopsis lyrata subsp. lyrata]EFH52208.1 hypothetical protein ARALYDRAFT_906172 [Arabidopsis lyrata subsp. lyrata]|eukprot:XP_002875949.1 uncharacterized protein LOC9313716 isoform X2 [Arabidopsis lyrata subsp. lyrata]
MAAGEIITEQPPESIVGLIEKMAYVVALRGPEFEKEMIIVNRGDTTFSFMSSSDPNHALYQQKLTEYQGGKPPDFQPNTPATREPKGKAQSYDLEPPPSKEPRYTEISRREKELCTIKLIAQFVARYGKLFHEDLKRVGVMSPMFDFIKPTNSNFGLYNALVTSYSRVLKPSLGSPFFLDRIFDHLQLEKLEEGSETAMIDLFDFVGGVDFFAHMDDAHYPAILPPPQPFSMITHLSDLQADDSAIHECVGHAETSLGPPTIRITPKEFGVIKLTALFVARYRMPFRRALMMRVAMNPLFEFMFFLPSSLKKRLLFTDYPSLTKRVLFTDPSFGFVEPTEIRFNIFNLLVDAYSRVLFPCKKLKKSDACTRAVVDFFLKLLHLERLEEGVAAAVIDLHAFVGGVDRFAHLDDEDYSASMPPPERLSVMMNRVTLSEPDMLLQLPLGSQLASVRKQYKCVGDIDSLRAPTLRSVTFRVPGKGITLKELGIIKLTAQFVVRYGYDFWCVLTDRVSTNSFFQFLNPFDKQFRFYCGLLLAYTGVLKPSKMLKKPDACTVALLEGFFHRLQLWKLEEGVETAMIDLHAFVCGVDCFAHMEDGDYFAIMDPPERPSIMINQLIQIHTSLGSRLTGYHAQNQGGTQDIRPDAPATHECDSDAQRDLEFHSAWEKRIVRSYHYPYVYGGGITLEELGIMKFTALFVARYGMHFCQELMKEVVMKPQFKFMEPTNQKFSLYNVVVDAYSRVVYPFDDACTETVLEDFFRRLQLEKLAVEEEAMIDLHAFVSGVDYFADLEDVDYYALMPPPELLSIIMNRMRGMRKWLPLEYRRMYPPIPYTHGQCADSWYRHCPCTHGFADPSTWLMQTAGPKEPETKRQKFDESALVPEDQFLAKNPGPSRIRVVVADSDNGAIEITVKSLSEKVASLKKKIAREIRIPANKQMLSGKARVLKDNRSLAHYNVGAGEILTVSR